MPCDTGRTRKKSSENISANFSSSSSSSRIYYFDREGFNLADQVGLSRVAFSSGIGFG